MSNIETLEQRITDIEAVITASHSPQGREALARITARRTSKSTPAPTNLEAEHTRRLEYELERGI